MGTKSGQRGAAISGFRVWHKSMHNEGKGNEEAIALVTRPTCKTAHPCPEEMTKRYSSFGFAKETRAKPKLLKACSRTTEGRERLNLVP